MTDYIETIQALPSNWRFVQCGQVSKGAWDQKAAVHSYDKPVSKTAAVDWLKGAEADKPRKVGIVPADRNLFCFDCDDGNPADLAMHLSDIGVPFFQVQSSKPGRVHIYAALKKGESAWEQKQNIWKCGGATGDIRFNRGYVILWKPTDFLNEFRKIAKGINEHDVKPAELSQLTHLFADKKTNAEFVEGNRNNALNGACFNAGLNNDRKAMEQAIKQAREAGLLEDEIESVAERAYADGQKAKAESLPHFEGGALVAMDGHDLPDHITLKKILDANGIGFRFDLRGNKAEVRRGDGKWLELTDQREDQLILAIERAYKRKAADGRSVNLKYAKTQWERSVGALCHDHAVDAFIVDYIARLPAWDGQERLDDLIHDAFTVNGCNTPLLRWASRYMAIAPIQRAYEPNCELKQMPVLAGDTDIGKSSFVKHFVPPLYSRWFNGGLSLRDRKEFTESLAGTVICEIAELAGIDRNDLEAVKSMLTDYSPQVRQAYGRKPTRWVRRDAIVATVDRKQFLPNEKGNTRFCTIELWQAEGRPHFDKYFAEVCNEHGHSYRDQLFAEGLHLYRNGTRANLPFDLRETQASINIEYRRRDESLSELFEALRDDQIDGCTMIDVVKSINLIYSTRYPQNEGPYIRPGDRPSETKIGKELAAKGWEKKREMIEGSRLAVYRRK